MSYTKNIICINCCLKGHAFKECIYPVSSYGIIAFKKFYKDDGDIDVKFLLVQRKDSIGYIDFVRGKYDPKMKKEDVYRNLLGEMTLEEKNRLLTKTFDQIWDSLWMNKKSRVYNNDYVSAKRKMTTIDFKTMIRDSIQETKWESSEFSIPKGRRNNSEKFLDCALREFSEESGFIKSDIKYIYPDNFEEVFYGSNGLAYRHVYYLAEIERDDLPEIDKTNVLQAGEIKYLNWFSYKEAMNVFRNYDSTKRNIIYRVNNYIKNSLFKKNTSNNFKS